MKEKNNNGGAEKKTELIHNYITPKNRFNNVMDGFEYSSISLDMQNRIFDYTKSNQIQISQFYDLKGILMDCTIKGGDYIDKDEFFEKMEISNFRYPNSFIKNLLKDIEVDKETIVPSKIYPGYPGDIPDIFFDFFYKNFSENISGYPG